MNPETYVAKPKQVKVLSSKPTIGIFLNDFEF